MDDTAKFTLGLHPGHPESPERHTWENGDCDVSYVLDADGREICSCYGDNSKATALRIIAALSKAEGR